MRFVLVFCCFVSIGLAKPEKQIRLEDIERDNLEGERQAKETRQGPKTPPKMQYGFVPMKVHHQKQQSYAPASRYETQSVTPQVQYKEQYENVQYIPQTSSQGVQQQQYENLQYIMESTLANAYYQPQGQGQDQSQTQFYYLQPGSSTNTIHSVVDPKTGQVQYYMLVPQEYFSGGENAVQEEVQTQTQSQVNYASLPKEQVGQKYTQVVYNQEQYQQQQQQQQPEVQYYQSNIPVQHPVPFQPNPVYVQQVQSSTSTKGGINTNYAATQNLAGQIQGYGDYRENYAPTAPQGASSAILSQPSIQQNYVSQNYIPQQQTYYKQQQQNYNYKQQQQPIAYERIISQSHASLLDSYVPSILQIKYYKEQEARLKALQQQSASKLHLGSQNGLSRGYLPLPTPLSYTHSKRGATGTKS